jgi:serine protease Do
MRYRHLGGYALLAGIALFSPLSAEKENPQRLLDALALEQTLEDAIARADPSIACILVSRSDQYPDFEKPSADERERGKLGGHARNVIPEAPRRFNLRQETPVDPLDLSDPNNVPEAYGSGVVVDASGLILTNYHVVRDATKLYVRLPNGKGSYADIHAADSRSDLAVLRPIEKLPDLKPLKHGDASKLRKGQFVLSLANPFAAGFRDGSPSASWGIISNIRRRPPGNPNEVERTKNLHNYGTLLQLDARLNLGCSGGALLDLKGELIGLTTAQAALSGVETPGGFAVPMDAGMWRIVEQLKKGEEVEYGFLGVSFQPDTGAPPANRPDGVTINTVIPGSPADESQPRKIQTGDIILTVDGVRVFENEDLFVTIGTQLAGRTVELEVKNKQGLAPAKLTVKLAKFKSTGKYIASKVPPALGGLRVDYTSLLAQPGIDPRFGRGIPVGVIVREVIPGSAADKAQLQPDKVITQVNDQRVTSPTEFYLCMENAMENARKNRKSVELSIQNFDRSTDTVKLDLP